MVRRKCLSWFFTGAMLSTSGYAVGTSPEVPAWKTIEGVDTVLVEKHDTPLVNFVISFPEGSYSDPKGKEGLANLAGEMLLRGTKKHSREQIENELDFLGASLGVDTGFHSFQVRGQVLRRNLDKLVDLVVEILTEATIPDSELTKLQEEVIAHLHLRLDNDGHLARHWFNENLYGKHPYSRDGAGSVASVKNVTRNDVTGYLGARLQRNGALIGASGNLKADDYPAIVAKLVNPLPKGKIDNVAVRFEGKVQGRHVLLVDKPERTQTQFYIGHPAIAATHEDYIPLKIFLTAFGGHMFQAQYMQEIRVKRGWAYGAYAGLDVRRDGGAFYMQTAPAVKDTLPALKLSIELFEKAIEGPGLTDEAIEFARTYLIRSYPFLIDIPEKILSQRLYNRLVGHSDDYLDTYVERLKNVSIEDIRAVAKKHLTVANLQIVMLCTAKDFRESLKKELAATSVDVIPFDKI